MKKKRLLQLFAILQFFDAYSSLFFLPPPVSFKVLSRGVVIPSFTFVATTFSAPNTETASWWRWSGEVYLLPSATFFPAGVYTGPNAPETNRFARHGLYYSICATYLYMVYTVRIHLYGYTVYCSVQDDSPKRSPSFFSSIIWRLFKDRIFKIFKYYYIIVFYPRHVANTLKTNVEESVIFHHYISKKI